MSTMTNTTVTMTVTVLIFSSACFTVLAQRLIPSDTPTVKLRVMRCKLYYYISSCGASFEVQ
eukprot:15631-Heterococcus_DN1.PRE.4